MSTLRYNTLGSKVLVYFIYNYIHDVLESSVTFLLTNSFSQSRRRAQGVSRSRTRRPTTRSSRPWWLHSCPLVSTRATNCVNFPFFLPTRCFSALKSEWRGRDAHAVFICVATRWRVGACDVRLRGDECRWAVVSRRPVTGGTPYLLIRCHVLFYMLHKYT